MNKDLIFGKGQQDRIVSVEDTGSGTMELFIQKEDGSIEVKTELHNYWILTDQKADAQSIELGGDGYFKWRNNFDFREDFDYAKKQLYKKKDKCFWINDQKEQFLVQSGHTYFKGLKHSEVSVLSFDIETTGIELNKDSKVLIISNTFRDSFGNIERKIFCYDDFESPKAMFIAWAKWVVDCDPALLIGYNVHSFDLAYIDYCCKLCNIELNIGRESRPLKIDRYDSKFRKDQTQFIEYKKCRIYGREVVDCFHLAVKHDVVEKKYENYKLKTIIKQEGLEKKDRQFYDASLIRKNYRIPEEWKKIKDYCRDDSDDSLALWDMMGAAAFYWTQSVPKSFGEVTSGATGSQINSIMVRAYFQDGHSLPKADEPIRYEGAISFGNPKIYRHAEKLDCLSMYPSILVQYNIYDKKKDPNGYFLEMTKTFRTMRFDNKKKAKETGDKYYKDLQESQKVCINSLYGSLNTKILFNSPRNAELVTKYGREIITKAIDHMETNNFMIANVDTDGIAVCKQDMTSFSKEERINLLSKLNNKFPEHIKFENDGSFSTFVVLKAKNYIMFSDGELKIKGSGLKSSKTELAIKDFHNELIKAIIDDKPHTYFIEIYTRYITETMNVSEIKRWSSKKTITKKVMTSERTNETKIKDAIVGSEYQEADKVYVYFKEDKSLALAENFDGNYDKKKLLKRMHDVTKIFTNILPVKDLFPNYSLKKNSKILETLLESVNKPKCVS